MLTNNKKDVTVKVNDIKSIKSIQKKINENDKITFIITTKDMEMLKTLQKLLWTYKKTIAIRIFSQSFQAIMKNYIK